MRSMALAGILTAVAFSGCMDGDGPGGNGSTHWMAGPALWPDPQNTPHPAFGWPTLSHPATGDVPAWWMPIPAAAAVEQVSGLEHVATTGGLARGGGIALFGSLAVVPGFGEPSHIVDISDPRTPRVLSSFEPQQNIHRGAAIIAYPDGRLVAVISTETVIDVWDITDPTAPEPLPVLEPSQGSHKVGVVPGTPIVYNAASRNNAAVMGNLPGAGDGVTEIFDLTDPERPVHVMDFENGYSCHHVFFWNDPAGAKQRALCAGKEVTQIWDTADPRNPTVVSTVPVHHGKPGLPSTRYSNIVFSHFAGLSMDGSILIVGDEMGGGSTPPGCVANLPTGAVGDLSAPAGATWFYDVTDEADPQLQGWFSTQNDPLTKDAQTSCTAHHGRLVPDGGGRDILAQAYYGAGVVLIDFTDPARPFAVDQFVEASDTWEVWYNQGYLFTGDIARGMDVLRVV